MKEKMSKRANWILPLVLCLALVLALLGWFCRPQLAGAGEGQLLCDGAAVPLSAHDAGVAAWILSRQGWKTDADLALDGVELEIGGALYCVDTGTGDVRRIEDGQAKLARLGLRDVFWLSRLVKKYI